MDTKVRVSAESWSLRRKLSCRSSQDLNPRPFDHKSSTLLLLLSYPCSCVWLDDCASSNLAHDCTSNNLPSDCASNNLPYDCASDSLSDDCASNNLPYDCVSDSLPYDCTSDNLPCDCVSDNLPYDCASNNLPYDRASNNLPCDCVSDNVPFSWPLAHRVTQLYGADSWPALTCSWRARGGKLTSSSTQKAHPLLRHRIPQMNGMTGDQDGMCGCDTYFCSPPLLSFLGWWWEVCNMDVYWAIQWSWFARVNALCNLSRKKLREVTAHFRADFCVGVASHCV